MTPETDSDRPSVETDHLALAKVDAAYMRQWSESPDARSVPAMLEVLARATIALAEEQRTANLIAILTAIGSDGRHAFASAEMETAIDRIGQRLGLGTPLGRE